VRVGSEAEASIESDSDQNPIHLPPQTSAFRLLRLSSKKYLLVYAVPLPLMASAGKAKSARAVAAMKITERNMVAGLAMGSQEEY